MPGDLPPVGEVLAEVLARPREMPLWPDKAIPNAADRAMATAAVDALTAAGYTLVPSPVGTRGAVMRRCEECDGVGAVSCFQPHQACHCECWMNDEAPCCRCGDDSDGENGDTCDGR